MFIVQVKACLSGGVFKLGVEYFVTKPSPM